MPDIKRILCPVDFSPASERALDFALELAEKLGAEVELLHVYQLPVYALPDGAMLAGPEFTARVSGELQQSLTSLSEKKAKGAKTRLLEGVPYREIVAACDDIGAGLIVMGTHGRTGIKHLLLGSVAERVVRTARVPVITVPTPD